MHIFSLHTRAHWWNHLSSRKATKIIDSPDLSSIRLKVSRCAETYWPIRDHEMSEIQWSLTKRYSDRECPLIRVVYEYEEAAEPNQWSMKVRTNSTEHDQKLGANTALVPLTQWSISHWKKRKPFSRLKIVFFLLKCLQSMSLTAHIKKVAIGSANDLLSSEGRPLPDPLSAYR